MAENRTGGLRVRVKSSACHSRARARVRGWCGGDTRSLDPALRPDGSDACPWLFHRSGWIYEATCDGWRIGAYKDRRDARLVSRRDADQCRHFAELVARSRSARTACTTPPPPPSAPRSASSGSCPSEPELRLAPPLARHLGRPHRRRDGAPGAPAVAESHRGGRVAVHCSWGDNPLLPPRAPSRWRGGRLSRPAGARGGVQGGTCPPAGQPARGRLPPRRE